MKNIFIQLFNKFHDKLWSWYSISHNFNLTIDIIEKYPDKPWNWNAISQNKFKKNKIVTRKIIQRWYKKIIPG
jgi:hypothetical protein